MTVTALALGMHKLPGFDNPVLLSGVQFAPDSAPFTLYANFDKGIVGLILLAFVSRRASSWREFAGLMRNVAPIIAATTGMGVVVALGLHFARIDVKWPEATPLFLAVNLFLTVIAEETFFRGFIQERFTVALSAYRWHKVAAISASALLFGVAHVGGGAKYAALATIAGLGYAIAYQRTRRIESAIAAHFVLNAVHFLTLSYPYLR